MVRRRTINPNDPEDTPLSSDPDRPARGADRPAAGPRRTRTEPPAAADVPLREALRPSGPARFALRVEHRTDAVVVHVEGELDILTVPKLAARLNGVIRGSAVDVVLDLRELRFMDSAGLQLLLTTRRRLLHASRDLSVLCGEGAVRQVIELARLTSTLHVTSP